MSLSPDDEEWLLVFAGHAMKAMISAQAIEHIALRSVGGGGSGGHSCMARFYYPLIAEAAFDMAAAMVAEAKKRLPADPPCGPNCPACTILKDDPVHPHATT